MLPVAELAIAAGLLVPASAWWSALAAAGLLAVFMAAIGVSMARGAAPGCHCFGRLHSAPVSWSTQVKWRARRGRRCCGAGRTWRIGPEPGPLAGHLNAAEFGLAAAVVVLCAVAAGQGWFLYGLSRQNGRVLARLQNLEQRIGVGGPPAGAGLAGVRHASGQGHVRGLAVGAPARGSSACRRRAARLAAGASWPGIAGAAHLLRSRMRSLRRAAPAGGQLAASASRPPHGCARNPATCRAEGRHAGDRRVARCACASQPRTRRGLPGKRHPERSADRRQRKNREPPGLRRAGNHPAHPQRNHQRPPGRPGGGTRRQRRGTKLTRQARTCRRRRGTRPCADRSAGPCTARPAGPRVSQCRYRIESFKTRSPAKQDQPGGLAGLSGPLLLEGRRRDQGCGQRAKH